MTWTTSAAVAAKTAVCSSRPVPAVRGVVVSRVTRSARWPTAMLPASSYPRLAWPFFVAASSSSAADQWPRSRVARRSSSSTARISSNRSMTAWLSEPRVSGLPCVVELPARADAVAEVALGGGAEAGVGPRVAEVLDVVVGQVRGVHGAGQRAEDAVVGEQLGGRGAVRRDAGVVLLRPAPRDGRGGACPRWPRRSCGAGRRGRRGRSGWRRRLHRAPRVRAQRVRGAVARTAAGRPRVARRSRC